MDTGSPSIMTMNIRENYLRIRERITNAAVSAGRDPLEIELVVVTKTHPIQVIQSVIDAGATDLGENYVEEAVPKIQAIDSNTSVRWHMIGHVQGRKASYVCQYFRCLHSLDSLRLAERLCRFATEMNITLPAYLELNVSGEASKSGWDIGTDENWENILPDIERIVGLPRLNILGVMTIPPYSTDPEASRPYYRKLRRFQEFAIGRLQLVGFYKLSIGMSVDFEVAIQEGSTCVRIGQAILGPRAT